MSNPYYADDFVTLYLGDCREEQAWLQADVLVTDPPYGMSYQSGHRRGAKLPRIAGDHDTAVRDHVVQAWGDRPAGVFGRWAVPPPIRERARLVWWERKAGTPGMGDLAMPWGPAHEDIHVLGTGWAKTTKREGSVIQTHGGRGGAHGEENATGHPTPKPVQLMQYLIERCPPGVVGDPFAGSGSTLVAAKSLGRRAIGVELEERYCEVSAIRLAQDVLPLDAS